MTIKELTHLKFGEILSLESIKSKQPITASLEITPFCNFSCLHCSIIDDYRNSNELPLCTDDIYKIVDQFEKIGIVKLIITGGEPLLNPDFINIWKYIIQKGIFPILFTNGSLISATHIELFKKYRPLKIAMSMYAFEFDTFNKFTKQSFNTFNNMHNAISLLKKNELPLKIRYICTKSNKTDIKMAVEYFENNSIKYDIITDITPSLKGGKDCLKERLTIKDKLKIDAKYSKLDKELKLLSNQKVKMPLIRKKKCYECNAFKLALNIDAFGNLCICFLDKINHSRNIKNKEIMNCYKKMQKEIMEDNRKNEPDPNCNNCKASFFCSLCPAKSMLEVGTINKIVPYICKVTQGKYRKYFGDDIYEY